MRKQSWIQKNRWLVVWTVLSIVVALMVHCLFRIPAPFDFWEAQWTAGEILTYISTISLGLLAFWQNQKIQEEQRKKDDFHLATEKYALFDFEELEAEFYSSNNTSIKNALKIKSGFNGNKAIWEFTSYKIMGLDKLKLQFKIKNIGNVPATNLFVADKNGKKINESNVLYSADDKNDKKYIPCNDIGILIINCDILSLKKRQEYYLRFTSPFGSQYTQKIIISALGPEEKLISIDTQCQLNITEDK